MKDDERWSRIVSAEARGRSLSGEEREWCEQFEREAGDVSIDRVLWAGIGALGTTAKLGEMSDIDVVARVMAEAEREEEREAAVSPDPRNGGAGILWPRRTWRRVALVVGAMAATMALGRFVFSDAMISVGASEEEAHVWQDSSARPKLAERQTLAQHTPGEARKVVGDQFLAKGRCIHLWEGSKVCAIEDAQIELDGAAEAGFGPSLRLESGGVQIEIEGRERGVTLRTSLGVLQAMTGSFSAMLSPRTTSLTVVSLTGRVMVTGSSGGLTQEVASGKTLRLSAVEREFDPRRARAMALSGGLDSVDSTRKIAKKVHEKRASDEQLAKAQRLLASGKQREAIRAYETLIRSCPDSSEAHTAMVSLGRLHLVAKNARRALRYFDRYLRQGRGSLTEEAQYGRIRALRDLGHIRAEVDAIGSFVREHPASVHASPLARRADLLESSSLLANEGSESQ